MIISLKELSHVLLHFQAQTTDLPRAPAISTLIIDSTKTLTPTIVMEYGNVKSSAHGKVVLMTSTMLERVIDSDVAIAS